MNKEVRERSALTTRDIVGYEIGKNPVLIPEYGVNTQVLNKDHAEGMAELYKGAYERGDFFGNRYEDLSSQVFNPSWWQEMNNPDSAWIVFTRQDKLVGATVLINEGDPDCMSCAINIDETQIALEGRGMRIMDHYFRRIVPILEKLGIDITTEFVLTPQSKGLRRTLQTELGMTALGVHPNILTHRLDDANLKSEISAAKYSTLEPKQAIIMPQFAQLLSMVRQQLPVLPEPEVVISERLDITSSRYANKYTEVSVRANDPEEQKFALDRGYQPVKYDPKKHEFAMAKFPPKKPNLDFMERENIGVNTELVDYLNTRLYSEIPPHGVILGGSL